jgi:hypothetical protein
MRKFILAFLDLVKVYGTNVKARGERFRFHLVLFFGE